MKGRLHKVVESAKQLVEKSKVMLDSEENGDIAVPKLTPGGIIMLTRTLDKLDELLTTHQQASAESSS